MKKIILLVLAFTLFSCNDGDFDVPTFEFSDVISSCGEYILFKKNSESTEVLVLTLSNSDLGSSEGDKAISITPEKVIYRIFDAAITDDYFCASIPPTTPLVLKDIYAESGSINIITTVLKNQNNEITGYSYDISFSELLFLDEDGQIFYQNFDFGTFTVNL
jgi:hypothetical protein